MAQVQKARKQSEEEPLPTSLPQPLGSPPNLVISVPRILPEVVHRCTLNNITWCHMLVHKELSRCLFLSVAWCSDQYLNLQLEYSLHPQGAQRSLEK